MRDLKLAHILVIFSYQSLFYSSVLYGFDFYFICHVQPLVAHELKIYLFIYL